MKNNDPFGLRDELLHALLVPYGGSFKSGQQANNKLEFDRIYTPEYKELRNKVAAAFGHLIRHYILPSPYANNGDALIPVPTGANRIGKLVARSLGMTYIQADKDPDTREFSLRPEAEQALESCRNIVLLEDVPNGLNSLREMSALPQIQEKLIGAVGCFDRGDRRGRPAFEPAYEAIVQDYIPAQIPVNSELWAIMFPPKE